MSLKSKLSFGLALIALSLSQAQADERYRPVDDKMVLDECGACHMAFQPQMLPKRSWEKIMATLPNHFGEDASLSAEKTQHILSYHIENASDSGWWSGKFLRGVKDSWTPMRITEIPYWIREHNEEVPAYAWNDPKVKTKANCLACHPRAKNGDYDDD